MHLQHAPIHKHLIICIVFSLQIHACDTLCVSKGKHVLGKNATKTTNNDARPSIAWENPQVVQEYCLHRVVFFNGFSRCLRVYLCILKHTKKNTCIHVALYGGCGAAVTAAATTAFICVFLTIKSSTKSNTIVSQSLMHKCYCACLTTESMHQQQSNRTSAPCAVFSISSRQIYTSSHSLNNNNKHTLSHLIFPMTPSLLLLPLQPSSMPPPALPLLYSPPEFTNNPMVLGMVRRNSIHSTPMHVLFSPFSSHRMLCFVLLFLLCNCLTTIACGKLPPRVTQYNAVVKHALQIAFLSSLFTIQYISQFMLCLSLPVVFFSASLMLLLFCTNVASQSFWT